MKKLNKSELTLIFFIIIACVIRFWNIGFQATNYDEQFTMNIARPTISILELVITTLTFDYTPPLYYLCAHISMVIFGATQSAIRYPSAIFGVLLIPVIYYIGKEYKDELFGLIMAGFTTIYYNSIFYSRYGRSYAMDLVFCSITFYFFMRILKGDKHSELGFSIFALLSLWTHLYSIIPIGIMILYLLYERKIFNKLLITIIGSLPLLNYVNLMLTTRRAVEIGTNSFGAKPIELLFVTPLEMFTYSAFIIFPIIIWSIWKHKDEKIIRYISYISLITWVSLFIISFITPVIPHYAIFLFPLLLIPLVLPFYNAIKEDDGYYFIYGLVVMVIIILEIVQIVALNTVQRM